MHGDGHILGYVLNLLNRNRVSSVSVPEFHGCQQEQPMRCLRGIKLRSGCHKRSLIVEDNASVPLPGPQIDR